MQRSPCPTDGGASLKGPPTVLEVTVLPRTNQRTITYLTTRVFERLLTRTPNPRMAFPATCLRRNETYILFLETKAVVPLRGCPLYSQACQTSLVRLPKCAGQRFPTPRQAKELRPYQPLASVSPKIVTTWNAMRCGKFASLLCSWSADERFLTKRALNSFHPGFKRAPCKHCSGTFG